MLSRAVVFVEKSWYLSENTRLFKKYRFVNGFNYCFIQNRNGLRAQSATFSTLNGNSSDNKRTLVVERLQKQQQPKVTVELPPSSNSLLTAATLSCNAVNYHIQRCSNYNGSRLFHTSRNSNDGSAEAISTQDESVGRPNFKALDTEFEDAKEAYRSKTTSELFRALLVFNLTSFDILVKHNIKV